MLKKILKEKKGSLLLIGGIIIVVIFFNMSSNRPSVVVEDVNIKELLNKITNNYTMSISISNSLENKVYNYATDSSIILFDYGDYSNSEYLIYNNNTYKIDSEYFSLTKSEDVSFVNDPYINLELIKKLFNHCEFEYVNDTNVKCTIKVNDYLDEYNNVYNTNYSYYDEDMNINVSYYSTRIHSISLEYSNVDKVIHGKSDILKYTLTFSDIGKNDFSNIKKYYKNEL